MEVYARPFDPECPVVCLDEQSKQLIDETRSPLPAEPGQPAKVDYEYQRRGTCNLLMMCQPLGGWRHVQVTDHRTRKDWAEGIRDLVDVHFPSARKVILVEDNPK